MPSFRVAQLDELDPILCPCGVTRRAFASSDNRVPTLHLLDVQKDARVHYHKKLTEMYLILQGTGYMELDHEVVPVKPMTALFIEPGCRHRAVGKLKVAVIPIPAFDAEDEWFD